MFVASGGHNPFGSALRCWRAAAPISAGFTSNCSLNCDVELSQGHYTLRYAHRKSVTMTIGEIQTLARHVGLTCEKHVLGYRLRETSGLIIANHLPESKHPAKTAGMNCQAA